MTSLITHMDCNEDIFLNSMTLKHRQRGVKEFSIGGRAMLSRSQSTDAILSRDINLRELENAETRGVNNKTFSEIYEENDGHPSDLENGAFMVENPQQALKKHDQAYMKQVIEWEVHYSQCLFVSIIWPWLTYARILKAHSHSMSGSSM